jgi:hypothetical protein
MTDLMQRLESYGWTVVIAIAAALVAVAYVAYLRKKPDRKVMSTGRPGSTRHGRRPLVPSRFSLLHGKPASRRSSIP